MFIAWPIGFFCLLLGFSGILGSIMTPALSKLPFAILLFLLGWVITPKTWEAFLAKTGLDIRGAQRGALILILFMAMGAAAPHHSSHSGNSELEKPKDYAVIVQEANQAVKEIKLSNSMDFEDMHARIQDRLTELSLVPSDHKLHQEAQTLSQKLRNLDQQILKRKEIADRKVARLLGIQARKEFAKGFEQDMLKSGIDAYVTAQGPEKRTLNIQWALISRPYVYKMINDRKFTTSLRSLGFTTINFSDGYDETYTSSL